MPCIHFDKRFIATYAGVAAVGVFAVCILRTKGCTNSIISFFSHCKESILRLKRKKLHDPSHSQGGNTTDGGRSLSFHQRGYTEEELMQYDGVRNKRILVSLRRKVFEVGDSLYGPGAAYHIFAGKEASRCVAKSILDETQTNKYWADCTEEELQALDEHLALFEKKYPVVGWFIPNDNFYEF
ncbi:unnamed protein product [Phytomonas sp. EM1]|nr:unnamed protein product [Phytomonas sp. EM1]|eukprot:CCW60703.1 unnamed protein product [Phytomonas sp. isolate EM1]